MSLISELFITTPIPAQTLLYVTIPYVCPEPVLAIWRFQNEKATKRRVFRGPPKADTPASSLNWFSAV